MPFCDQCGTPHAEGQPVCHACGARTGTADRKGNRTLLIVGAAIGGGVLIVLVLSAALLFAGWVLGFGSDEPAADVAGGDAGGGIQAHTSTGASTTSCDKSAPSTLPKPEGKPQLIYFYRDT